VTSKEPHGENSDGEGSVATLDSHRVSAERLMRVFLARLGTSSQKKKKATSMHLEVYMQPSSDLGPLLREKPRDPGPVCGR
jgi:hypothetical protein